MFDPKTRVLVVDDLKTMRKILANTLHAAGLPLTVEADDGSTAWALIEESVQKNEAFGLIICDWNMPQMPGIELLKRVRELEATKETPFIIVTAEAEQKKILEAIRLGVSNYVVKPISPAIFLEKLTAVYNKHKK